MRVLMHPGPANRPVRLEHLQAEDSERATRLITAGDLACLPDGCIAEPMEVFRTQQEAEEHMLKLARDNPGQEYRVTLNADCPV